MWDFLTSSDWITWLGHAAQGFLIVGAGIFFGFTPQGMVGAVALTFLHREIDNAWEAYRAGEARNRKVIDGFMDLLAPVAAAIIAASVFGG